MNRKKCILISIGFVFLLFAVIVCSASIGSAQLGVFDSLKIILSKIPILNRLVDISEIKPTYIKIIWSVRIPRIILAGLSGATLALVGACFQGLFRNPLADPQIIGVSSGAALGATVAVLSGITLNFLGLGIIGIFAFLGAVITALIVYKLSFFGTQSSVVYIVLIGAAISSMLSAVISLLMSLNREQIEKVYMWTLGSFSAATTSKVSFLGIFLILGAVILLLYAKQLNILSIGEETAQSLGDRKSVV